MKTYGILVLIRALLENMLNLFGIFNLKSLFSLNKKEKTRIAFQAYSIHLAQFYQTIIAELFKEQEKFDIVFIILQHPHFSISSTSELRKFVHLSLQIPKKNIRFYWQVLWEKFDLVVYSDVYAKFPIRKTKNCILMHGPGLTFRNVKKNILRKTLADFDLILLNGDYDYHLISTFYKNHHIKSKLFSVGLPFLDCFEKSNIINELYAKRFSLDSNKKTVLIAPSWTGLNLVQNEGVNYFEEIIPILKSSDVNIILKLHACSLNPAMGGELNWQGRLEKLANGSTIHIDDNIDDIPALKYADILITDISSRAFNFMLLDKPVILYFPIETGMDEWDRERFELMQQGSLLAKTPSDIKKILDELNENDNKRQKRSQVSKQCFSNHGKATEKTVNLIKQELGLEKDSFR